MDDAYVLRVNGYRLAEGRCLRLVLHPDQLALSKNATANILPGR